MDVLLESYVLPASPIVAISVSILVFVDVLLEYHEQHVAQPWGYVSILVFVDVLLELT